jgi:hypothetical protein
MIHQPARRGETDTLLALAFKIDGSVFAPRADRSQHREAGGVKTC